MVISQRLKHCMLYLQQQKTKNRLSPFIFSILRIYYLPNSISLSISPVNCHNVPNITMCDKAFRSYNFLVNVFNGRSTMVGGETQQITLATGTLGHISQINSQRISIYLFRTIKGIIRRTQILCICYNFVPVKNRFYFFCFLKFLYYYYIYLTFSY